MGRHSLMLAQLFVIVCLITGGTHWASSYPLRDKSFASSPGSGVTVSPTNTPSGFLKGFLSIETLFGKGLHLGEPSEAFVLLLGFFFLLDLVLLAAVCWKFLRLNQRSRLPTVEDFWQDSPGPEDTGRHKFTYSEEPTVLDLTVLAQEIAQIGQGVDKLAREFAVFVEIFGGFMDNYSLRPEAAPARAVGANDTQTVRFPVEPSGPGELRRTQNPKSYFRLNCEDGDCRLYVSEEVLSKPPGQMDEVLQPFFQLVHEPSSEGRYRLIEPAEVSWNEVQGVGFVVNRGKIGR